MDKGARKQSGIGVAGDIGGEWSPLLSDNLKVRIGGDLTRTDYSGGQFDDMTLSGYAGPQFLFHDWDLSLLGSGVQRWYANQDYLTGFGGKIAADYGSTSNMLISATFGGQAVTDYFIRDQSGPLLSTQLTGTYVLSPSSLFRLQLGFNCQDARIGAYSYSGVWFGGGYSQDLPFGFSAGFQPS